MNIPNPFTGAIRAIREASQKVDRLADPTPTEQEIEEWPALIRRQTPTSSFSAGSSSS